MRSVTIIGAGRVGGALAIALARAGYRIDSVFHRGDRFVPELKRLLPESTRFVAHSNSPNDHSDIVIIASGDPEIKNISDELALSSGLPPYALHTSGSLSSSELSALARKGVATASMHPLAALSDPVSGAERFRGAFFCIEGDAEAAVVANRLAADLGGNPFSIPTESKSLYHAAAVMAAGHVVALFDAAVDMLQRCGLPAEEASRVLLPLAAGSVANLAGRATAEALTGPFARGDSSAFERHLAAFLSARLPEDLRAVYLDLARRSAEMMIRDGRPFADLRERILMAKEPRE